MTTAPPPNVRRRKPRAPRRLDWAFDQKVGSSTGKMILCVICRFGNGKGTCFASIPKIAAMADCQEPAVRKWLKVFLARGWLVELDDEGRSTRTFLINADGVEFDTPAPVETLSAPAESDTQNPKNQNMNPSSRSPGGRQLNVQIPPELSPWEVIKFIKKNGSEQGGGAETS